MPRPGIRVTARHGRHGAACELVPSMSDAGAGPAAKGQEAAMADEGAKTYVAPALTVLGTLQELTARSDTGPSSDMPLAHPGAVFTVFS